VLQKSEPSSHLPPPNQIVALAASAGGIQALDQVLRDLPPDFPAAITVVQHLNPLVPSLLPAILARHTGLLVKQAETGELLKAATVYVAQPDWHLLISQDGTVDLTQTERVNYTRPAADLLFISLAKSYGQRTIAVVLTGKGRDGAAGIQAVKQMGGITIAQDPQTAQFAGMPTAAIQTQAVDWILPLHQIAPTLVQLSRSRSA
jgi:two-component system chemotaxis response regulator CheB